MWLQYIHLFTLGKDSKYSLLVCISVVSFSHYLSPVGLTIVAKYYQHSYRLLNLHSCRLLNLHSYRLLNLHSYRLLNLHSYRLLNLHSYRLLNLHSYRLFNLHSYRLLNLHSCRLLNLHSCRLFNLHVLLDPVQPDKLTFSKHFLVGTVQIA